MGARKYKRVSIQQIIDAIRQNGYVRTTGTLFRGNDDNYVNEENTMEPVKFGSACAMGQAAANLGINGRILTERLGTIRTRDYNSLYSEIVVANDDEDKSPTAIADILDALITEEQRGKKFLIPVQEYIYTGEPVVLEKIGA